jgi:DNA-binding MarR family transcriptional regulator
LPPPLDVEYLDVEILKDRYLDVKIIEGQNLTMPERDHVDAWLDQIEKDAELPDIDLEVEGIVDRIGGISRRLHKLLDDTVAEHGLTSGEWHVLGKLRRSGSSSPGKLAAQFELSSGAITNRLDRLEQAGLLRRVPDPADRRAVRVELTDDGRRRYLDAVHAQAAKEALVADALTPREQQQLNALLRKLMLRFEREETKQGG